MRNLKRALSLALASIMVLGMMVVGASAVSTDDFSDGENIVNKEAVTVLASLNVINGKDDGSYDPTGIVTRAEMAKMICVVLNGGRDPQLGAVVSDTYTDTTTHWAKAYIEYCTNLGIVAGRGNGTFDPNGTVTMAEAAKMLLVAVGYNASIEGYVGANWQINTDVQANQQDLYEGISATNTNVDLTRDNAAQMVYNALECQMVKYEYVVTTDGSVVATKPQVTTEGLGNVLQEKFKASKVEAVVVSNEVASVDSKSYTAADDEGETTLAVISIDGNKTSNGTGTYKVSTDKDLLGQNVVVYIKYKNTVGYDEDDAIVIGTPIPTSKNKVVTSTDGTEVADVADDNKLDLTDDTVYLVNFGGYYEGLMYGDNPALAAADKAPTADKDNKVTAMSKAQFDHAAKATGVTVTLIDNDGDKKVDYALAEKYSFGTVNKYVSGDKAALRIQGLFNEDEYKAENVVGFDDVALNDQVLFCEYGGKLYVQKPETMEAKLDSYSTSKKNVKLDGETIKWSGLNGIVESDQDWVGDYVVSSGVLNTTAVYHKDVNGYIFGVSETDEALLTYAVLMGFENQTASSSGDLGKTARARLLMADGTIKTYDVSTIDGKKVTNCTGAAIGSTKAPLSGQVGFNTTDQYNIYSYSLTESGAVKLVDRTDLNKTASQTKASDKNAAVDYDSGKSTIAVSGAGNFTVTDRTVFLYNKTDGSNVRYQGRTSPSIDSADGKVQVSVRASARGEALVVYFNNTNPSADFKDNWAYVYNTKVAQNGDSYEVSAIIDGKVDTFMVDAAYNADEDQVIEPDELSGSYYHVMPVGLYNYSLDDGIYTLNQKNTGVNSKAGTVAAVGSSYIRITLSDGTKMSYTLNSDSLLFEARKNKTAQEISTVSKGDKVSIVFNDDGEIVYCFLTQYSYEGTTPETPQDSGEITAVLFEDGTIGLYNPKNEGIAKQRAAISKTLLAAGYSDIVWGANTTITTVTDPTGATVGIASAKTAYPVTAGAGVTIKWTDAGSFAEDDIAPGETDYVASDAATIKYFTTKSTGSAKVIEVTDKDAVTGTGIAGANTVAGATGSAPSAPTYVYAATNVATGANTTMSYNGNSVLAASSNVDVKVGTKLDVASTAGTYYKGDVDTVETRMNKPYTVSVKPETITGNIVQVSIDGVSQFGVNGTAITDTASATGTTIKIVAKDGSDTTTFAPKATFTPAQYDLVVSTGYVKITAANPAAAVNGVTVAIDELSNVERPTTPVANEYYALANADDVVITYNVSGTEDGTGTTVAFAAAAILSNLELVDTPVTGLTLTGDSLAITASTASIDANVTGTVVIATTDVTVTTPALS